MINRISNNAMNTQISVTQSKGEFVETTETIEPVSFPTETSSVQNVEVLNDLLPPEKAKKMAESMNKFLETTSTELRFEFHKELKEYYVTLVNSKTNEVVKEVPSKKLMDMYAAMRDFVGFFVDEKI